MLNKSRFKIIEKKDYVKKRSIGRGGYGQVNLVEKDGKEYAMKILLDVNTTQFLREIDILCRVDHPAVIKLYGYNIFGKNLDEILMVIDYMKNGNLKQALQKEKAENSSVIDSTKKMIWIYGIAKGMEYCHKKNILHRDLKPENILLNENYEPCITDFGLSKVTDVQDAFMQSCVAGTECYRSPEMTNKEECDDKSDVYSYGLIVYFIFSGQDPPTDFYLENVMNELIQDFPDEIIELIQYSCKKNRDERISFKEIVECYEDINNCIKGIDENVYLEYVNRINNYQSSDDIDDGLMLDGSNKIKLNFSIYIKIKSKKVTPSSFFFECVKKISNDQFLVTQKRNIYLLRSLKDINEKSLVPKLVSYSKLNHFAILKLKGVALASEESPTYILKNNVSNGSLADIIQKEKENNAHPDWNFTKKIITLYGVAKAMAYLHSKNIIHHNLNPNNIFFDWNLYPYITNFEMGIDLKESDMPNLYNESITNLICLAPEIIQKNPANEKTDVYSFSIIMFYIFTLNYPFTFLKGINKMKRIINGFRDIIPDEVPKNFKSLITSCWSQSQAERPTFEQIVNCIESYAKDLEQLDLKEFEAYCEKVNTQESQCDIEGDYYDRDLEPILNKRIDEESEILLSKGIKFEQKSDIKENIEKAFECYSIAANVKGNKMGNYQLGLLYKNSAGDLKRSLALAKVNFEIAAEDDDIEISELAQEELKSTIEMMKDQDINELLSKSEQQYFLPIMKKDDKEKSGKRHKKDEKEKSGKRHKKDDKGEENLLKKYMEGIQNGDDECMKNYARLLYEGDTVKQDKKEAVKYYQMAIDRGNVRAMFNYASILRKGDEETPANKEEALKLYKKAADLGNTSAMFNYAMMVDKGEGTDANKEEALKYFRLASDKGNSMAMNYLALMMKEGNGIEQNKEEAANLFKMAADNGNTNGMFNYAQMKEIGDGVEIDKKEAAKYYKLMADKGQPDGMFHYGRMLENGEGVDLNVQEAINYYKNASRFYPKAAEAYKRLTENK